MTTPRPTRATVSALEGDLTFARAQVEARDAEILALKDKVDDLEDALEGLKRGIATRDKIIDEAAAEDLKTRLRLDAALYAMVLMQGTIKEQHARAQAERHDMRWDGKTWVALAT